MHHRQAEPAPVLGPAPARRPPIGKAQEVPAELDVDDLPVEGRLPDGLAGDYLRNGAVARFPPIGRSLDPFDGDAMVHRVRFRPGAVSYRNRFVRTPALLAELAAGRALWPGVLEEDRTAPGPALVGPALAHSEKDRPNMHVVRHAGRLLALGESTDPFLLSDDLDTIGRETFGGLLTGGMTAHPKLDPRTGELVLFAQSRRPPYLTWSVLDQDGAVRRAPTPVDGLRHPTLLHDVGLTENYLVFLVSPLRLSPPASFDNRWVPEDGSSVALVPRDGGPPTWLRTPAFWAWHVATAFEDAGAVVVDHTRRGAPDFLDVDGSGAALARLRIGPLPGQVEQETLVPEGIELVAVDPRTVGREPDVVAVTVRSGAVVLPRGSGDMLGWYDLRRRTLTTWHAGGLVVGEPCFAAGAGTPDPHNGWWLVLATDPTGGPARLLVFEAAHPSTGPVASVRLPHHVPVGLHGSWTGPGAGSD